MKRQKIHEVDDASGTQSKPFGKSPKRPTKSNPTSGAGIMRYFAAAAQTPPRPELTSAPKSEETNLVQLSAPVNTTEIVEDEHISVPTNTNASALFHGDKAEFFSQYMAGASIASSDNVGEHAQYAHRCLLASHQRKNAHKEEWTEKNKARYSFLNNVMDEHQHKPDHPEYDPRTLYIPVNSLSQMTAFERQYWEIKKKIFDAVVFFNKGMFFEMFELDADVGSKELGLRMTERAGMRMVGFTKDKFTFWAAKLIALGYKIARVEQKESPTAQAKNARDSDSTGKSRVLKRELDRIISPGTIVDEELLAGPTATYLLSIIVRPHLFFSLHWTSLLTRMVQESESSREFGVCFVDTSTGEICLSHLEDDVQLSKLRTLLIQLKPREIVYKKGNLRRDTVVLLKQSLVNPIINMLKQEEWVESQQLLDKLTFEDYFFDPAVVTSTEARASWPPVVVEFAENDLVMSALGGCVGYLDICQIAKQVISQKSFTKYDPINTNSTTMVIDSRGLATLEIFQSEQTFEPTGSLFELLDQCETPFGKRLLKKWVCFPLRDVNAINARLDAIASLHANNELMRDLSKLFSKLPDLERMLARCHSGTMSLLEFLRLLDALDEVKRFYTKMQLDITQGWLRKSSLLQSILTLGLECPKFVAPFETIASSFDRQLAKELSTIQPSPGVSSEYDQAKTAKEAVLDEFSQHLISVREFFKSNRVEYTKVGKDEFVLEMPKEVAKVKVSGDYIEMKGTAKVARYQTTFILKNLFRYKEAEEELQRCEKNVLSAYLRKLDSHRVIFSAVVHCLAQLDCLASLSKLSFTSDGFCRPIFREAAEPFLNLEDLRHPCLISRVRSEFVPNTIRLGCQGEPSVVLLTGPNMGGKSTLLRQVCIAVIMAHIGCYVNASKCELSLVDRIFTRLGAWDNIFHGQSTFMVELQETSLVLSQATKNSLVIMDELGRGTSTFDGYSIAYSTLSFLASQLKCRTLFSTHYHMLTEESMCKGINPSVALKHMSALVGGTSVAQDGDDTEKDVVFLYKMEPGACSKSYGLNVARMAGVPLEIVQRGRDKSLSFATHATSSSSDVHRRQLLRQFASLVCAVQSNDESALLRTWQLMNQ